MTTHRIVSLTTLVAFAAIGVTSAPRAHAKPLQIVDRDPPPPPPKQKKIPREVGVVALSTVEVLASDGTGGLSPFAHGVGLSMAWLQLKDEFPTGFEADAIFAFGPGEARLYDLGLSIIGSFEIRDKLAVPFASVGIDLAAVRVPEPCADDPDQAVSSGVTIGVHGNVGLHGFLTDAVYWRGQVGYIGAAIGGIKGQLSVGYAFD